MCVRLCARVSFQIVEFLRKREDFVDLVIKHIGTSAIMDLLLRMLTCIEPQQLRQDVLNVSRSCLYVHPIIFMKGVHILTLKLNTRKHYLIQNMLVIFQMPLLLCDCAISLFSFQYFVVYAFIVTENEA